MAALWLLILVPPALAAETTLLNRLVTEVLEDYEEAGFSFLYSTGLVRPSLKFSVEPPPGDPIARLKAGLEPLRLGLVRNQRGVWLIVPIQADASADVLRGRVLDAATGQPLSGVKVEIGEQVLMTDSLGRFELAVAQPQRLEVSLEGYGPASLLGDPKVDRLLEIPLAQERLMDEIVVVSSRYALRNDRTGMHALDIELFDAVPRLGEDPLRITSHLPGMSTIGVSAKPHIRGGLQDELLVLFNNVELLEPFHLRDFQSVFSSFNPSVIDTIDVYTGGFPIRYGDRMSGVMDIDPAREHRGRWGELSLSLLNAGILLHGNLQEERGKWAVSARRGNLDIVTRKINSTVGEPSYGDWFAQVRYELDAVTELDVGLIGYVDDIELSDFDEDGEIAESRYRNLYGWAQLHRAWSPRLDTSTILSIGSIAHDRNGFLSDEDLDNGRATVDDRRDFELYSLAQVIRFDVSKRVYSEFGVRMNYQRGSYDYEGVIERRALADLLGTDLNETRRYRLRPSGASGGVYGTVRVEPFEGVMLEGGIRWDFQDYTDASDSQVSPRASVKWEIDETSEIRFSAGRFYQPEAIHELLVGDGITGYQQEQYADHFILGWHRRFGERGFSMRLEAFAKDFHDPKRRFENLFNPLVLLPELASDRVEISPDRARARGLELTLRYEPDDAFMSWLSVTATEVEDRIDGRWVPRAWDQGGTVSTGLRWQNDRWTVAATALWHEGWRTTSLPGAVAEGEVLELRRNGTRLKDFLSVDLQVSRRWQWHGQSLTAFLEVTNLPNRHNVGGIEYEIEEDESNGGFLLTPQEETLLPLVPSLGIRWEF